MTNNESLIDKIDLVLEQIYTIDFFLRRSMNAIVKL